MKEKFLRSLLGWVRSGLPAQGEQTVSAEDVNGAERLARYGTRGPLPLDVVDKVEGGRLCVRTVPSRDSWARLRRRIFEVDPLLCPACGSEMTIVSVTAEPDVIVEILRHRTETGGQDPFEGRAPPAP